MAFSLESLTPPESGEHLISSQKRKPQKSAEVKRKKAGHKISFLLELVCKKKTKHVPRSVYYNLSVIYESPPEITTFYLSYIGEHIVKSGIQNKG